MGVVLDRIRDILLGEREVAERREGSGDIYIFLDGVLKVINCDTKNNSVSSEVSSYDPCSDKIYHMKLRIYANDELIYENDEVSYVKFTLNFSRPEEWQYFNIDGETVTGRYRGEIHIEKVLRMFFGLEIYIKGGN